jgi:DNA-binding Xre family transcriptional regulator
MLQIQQGVKQFMAGRIVNRLAELKREKEQRDGKTITWEHVAEGTGLAYSTVLRWANDNVDRYDEKALVKLCEFFGVQPGDILRYQPGAAQ